MKEVKKTYGIRIEPSKKKVYDHHAKKRKVDFSEFTREALDEKVEKHGK